MGGGRDNFMSVVPPAPARTPRQDEIVLAATALFARDGYRAVGMRAIADAVGIRTSSLYHHFSSKEELLYAISLGVTRDFISLQVPVLDQPGPAVARLAGLVRGHIVYFGRHGLQQSVSRRELRELTAAHVEEVLAYERRYQKRVESFIADGAREGDFFVADPGVAALALLDMVNGIGSWYRSGGRLSLEDLAELYVELALELMGARAAPALRAAAR